METWGDKHNKSGGSARDRHQTTAQDIFHVSSNMGWSVILHKKSCFLEGIDQRFCNISAYLSPVMLPISKLESAIFSMKKGPTTVDAINPHHTVTFSAFNGFYIKVLLISIAQILQLWEFTDPQSMK